MISLTTTARLFLRSLTSWALVRVDALRVIGRNTVSRRDGKNILTRIAQFGTAMFGGGIIVPAAEKDGSDEVPVIWSVVQFDGDVVTGLSPGFRDQTIAEQNTAIHNHFDDVKKALLPMEELQALIISGSTVARTFAVGFFGFFEVVPFFRDYHSVGDFICQLGQGVGLWTHLSTSVIMVFAYLTPLIIRNFAIRRVQKWLQKVLEQDWMEDRSRHAPNNIRKTEI